VDTPPPPPPPHSRTDYIFALEVWLKSLEAFFGLENLPLSADQRPQAALRNYAAELQTIRAGLGHVAYLANEMLGEERRDLTPFLVFLDDHRPVERSESISRPSTPEQELAFAIEKIHDLARIFDEVGKSSFIPLQTFRSAGRIAAEVLRKDPALSVFFSENLKSSLDADNKRNLGRIVERIAGTRYRKELVALLMELFKNLRSIELARECFDRFDDAKNSVLVLSLVRSETDRFCGYLKRKLLPSLPPDSAFAESLDRLIFSTEMELRKVHEVILVDVLLMSDPRTLLSRLEDAHGILKDLYQQNILQLAASFTDGLDGKDLFPDHLTKAEQSVRLRDDLWNLVVRCARFQEREDRYSLADLLGALDHFKRGSMRYLMFKDWTNFDRYLNEFSREATTKSLIQLAHQFDIYVRTLIREVSKRSVLSNVPFRPPEDPHSGGADTRKVRRVR
jgi:hypothetical protein